MEKSLKKIGIDVRLWNETGVGRYIRNLVLNLGNLDSENQYVLFGLSKDSETIKRQIFNTKYGKNFVFVPANMRWHSVSEQLEFPRLLNKYNLDLVHFPYFSVPVFYKKPFVVTIHDLIINHFGTGKASTLPLPIYKFKKIGYEFVLKKAIHTAAKVIVPSNATKDEILKSYKHVLKEKNIVVTKEGVDDSILDFTPVLFKEKNPYFLYVGNAYPHKNLEKLLEAFILFLEKYPDFSLKLVGKQDYFYKKLAGRFKNERIQFTGYVSDEKLASLYKNAEALFIPSFMEGFGLTALEGMQMKTLVAVSKISSLQETCGKNVFYFDPNDTLSIERTMVDIVNLEKEKKEKMLQEAYKHAASFSWEEMTKETIDIYNASLRK